NIINSIMQTDEWKSTVIIINYDDSDGWYDHQLGPIVNQSNSPVDDNLEGPGSCGVAQVIAGVSAVQNGRCGYGPRLPYIVISPFSKENFVDNRITDQSSSIRFIEDNWNLGRIGNGSTDAIAGSIMGMLDFNRRTS